MVGLLPPQAASALSSAASRQVWADVLINEPQLYTRSHNTWLLLLTEGLSGAPSGLFGEAFVPPQRQCAYVSIYSDIRAYSNVRQCIQQRQSAYRVSERTRAREREEARARRRRKLRV